MEGTVDFAIEDEDILVFVDGTSEDVMDVFSEVFILLTVINRALVAQHWEIVEKHHALPHHTLAFELSIENVENIFIDGLFLILILLAYGPRPVVLYQALLQHCFDH